MMNINYLSLIVVPQSLLKRLLENYHSGPTGRHRGEYKTIYRMRSKLYWPKIRDDIKTWVQSCAHCTTYNVWINLKIKLYSSYPITISVCIMHIGLWCHGKILYTIGNKLHLMNVMCNLMHSVVSTPTYNITADNLENLFMIEVFLNFGTCAVIVIDDGSTFKATFHKMCRAPKITYWCISRGNHKVNSVENFHQFLNKTQTITGSDRVTHAGFV